jgi:uncharacterized NAD(P)/FAD-binding protein YdhS
MQAERPFRIGIVGAGFSGTMLACHLSRQASRPISVLLFDRATAFGHGIAYSTRNPRHLLNVPFGNMSAIESEPDHFARWLEREAPHELKDGRFASRRAYGRYLRDTFEAACASDVVAISKVEECVSRIERRADGVDLLTADGRRFEAEAVVLCVGNSPPAFPSILGIRPEDAPRYIADPWHGDGLTRLAPTDSVIILGTGLTMIDVVLELVSRGHRGKLTAMSRHGLLPQVHETTGRHAPFLTDPLPDTAATLVRAVRSEARKAARDGVTWRMVVDALRSQTTALWQRLPLAERRRLLRHVRPYWDIHRHRMPPTVSGEIAGLMANGQLSVLAGRIERPSICSQDVSIEVRLRGHAETRELRADWLINCTGPSLHDRTGNALLYALFEDGLARPDPLSLGLDVTEDFRLIDAAGVASPVLYALGPPTRGTFWESTAVPDIRKQCEALARHLAQSKRA